MEVMKTTERGNLLVPVNSVNTLLNVLQKSILYDHWWFQWFYLQRKLQITGYKHVTIFVQRE